MGSSDEQPPAKEWRKCKHCLCDCQPKWKRCDCPCSQHPPWKCPNKPPKQTAAGSNNSNTNLVNLSSYLTGDSKNLPSSKSKSRDKEVVHINHHLTFVTRNQQK